MNDKNIGKGYNTITHEFGLRINGKKSKMMPQTRKMKPTRQNIKTEEYSFENEDNFICLSVQLTKSGNEINKIKQ